MEEEDPFFPSFCGSARPRRPAAAMAKPCHPAKVISVPVHFVGSAAAAGVAPTESTTSPAAAAVRIQSAFRGFLVRKNLGCVRRLEAEMDAIEREMREREERLRRDNRERVRLSEALMSVLLRLDSVRGVRERRRRAIRRAIALQEALDAIAFAKVAAAEEAPMEIQQAAVSPLETLGGGDRASSAGCLADGEEVKQEEGRAMDIGGGAKEAGMGRAPEELDRDQPAAARTVESSVTGEVISDAAPSIPSLSVVEGEGGQGCGENARQVLERVVQESRGLKGLVAELCERNEAQCRLMSGLLQRVEHLEKVVGSMGRKKRRQQTADGAKKTRARKCHRKL